MKTNNAKMPEMLSDGSRVERFTVNSLRYSYLVTLPQKAGEITDAVKKDLTKDFIANICDSSVIREQLDVGLTHGKDFNSSDGKRVLSLTVSAKDCLSRNVR